MPAAFCFDMYGTLFDPASVERRVRERVDAPGGVVDAFVALWREKQLQYAYQVALMDAYEPFSSVTEAAFEYAVDYHGFDIRATDRDAILSAYEELDPFDDAEPALDRLAETEADLAILSNGDPEMLRTLAANTGIADYFDAIVSADEVATFKPHPSVYENAADRLGHPLEECQLVSANAWDVAGAAQAGMATAWINRHNEPAERVGGPPEVAVGSLTDLLEANQ